jgi:hypothetical protein
LRTCEIYQEQISRMIDGDLPEAERTELLVHLEQCAHCRSAYAAFSVISSQLAEPDTPSVDLSPEIMAQIRQETAPKTAKPPRRCFSPLRFAGLAAGLVLILFAASRLPIWNAPDFGTAEPQETTTASSDQSAVSVESAYDPRTRESSTDVATDEADTETSDMNDTAKADSEQTVDLAPADQLFQALSDFYTTYTGDSEAAQWITVLMQLCPYASVSTIEAPEIYDSVPDLEKQIVSDYGTVCLVRLWQTDNTWTVSVALYDKYFALQIDCTAIKQAVPSTYAWILNDLSK